MKGGEKRRNSLTHDLGKNAARGKKMRPKKSLTFVKPSRVPRRGANKKPMEPGVGGVGKLGVTCGERGIQRACFKYFVGWSIPVGRLNGGK